MAREGEGMGTKMKGGVGDQKSNTGKIPDAVLNFDALPA